MHRSFKTLWTILPAAALTVGLMGCESDPEPAYEDPINMPTTTSVPVETDQTPSGQVGSTSRSDERPAREQVILDPNVSGELPAAQSDAMPDAAVELDDTDVEAPAAGTLDSAREAGPAGARLGEETPDAATDTDMEAAASPDEVESDQGMNDTADEAPQPTQADDTMSPEEARELLEPGDESALPDPEDQPAPPPTPATQPEASPETGAETDTLDGG